ncbi:FAD-dependent oxidoreductase [Streptacidiphilus sp. N1-12]|uniref:FAD-dependent oxidoreductase n=2 Tax=Streptacidiphilus alkalitolerans TaxID=3342712 RepID=A0ABV6V3I3_9ACTN
MRVVIAGAGLGGLCLAQGLRGAGMEAVVHERDASVGARPQGYRIHLDGRAAVALHACLPTELYQLFLATANRPSHRFTVVTKRLRELHTAGFPASEPTRPEEVNTAVDRSVLRTILLCGLGDAVRFGSEYVRYESSADGSVRAVFADGSTEAGDLLVGADGTGSRVRAQYLPQAQVPDTGDRTLYGRAPLTPQLRTLLPPFLGEGFTAVVASRRLGMAVGLVDFREPPRQAAARLWPAADFGGAAPYAMWGLSGQGRAFPSDARMRALDGPGLHQVALDMVRRWHPSLRALVEHATPAETAYQQIRVARPVEPWPATSVTLLGDAVHAMSPARGSGANIALKDAGRLCAELTAPHAAGSPVPAVARYETAMRDYGFAV